MTMPYESATTGVKARGEISKILQNFGCESVGFMDNHAKKELLLVFTHRGINIQLTANAKGWANTYLKQNPYHSRRRLTKIQYEEKALNQGLVAINSILRDWVKGQVTAIETDVLSFEQVFMPYMLLQDGRTVLEHAQSQNLLPAPRGEP